MPNSLEEKYNQSEKQLSRFRHLHHTFHEITQMESETEIKAKICHYLSHLIDVEDISLFLYDMESEDFQYQISTSSYEQKYERGYLEVENPGFLYEKKDFIKTRQFGENEVRVETPNISYKFQEQDILLLPVFLGSRVVGIFLGEPGKEMMFQDKDRLELINIFLNQVPALLEFFIEQHRLEEKNKELEFLSAIAVKLSGVLEEGDLYLDDVMRLIKQYLQVDRCSLMLMDQDKKTMRIKKAFGMTGVDVNAIKVKIGEGIAGYVAANRKALMIKDLKTISHLESRVTHKHFYNDSLLTVPLITQGELIGVINVNNRKDGQSFSAEDLNLLNMASPEIATLIQLSNTVV